MAVSFFACALDGNKILFLNNRSFCKSLASFSLLNYTCLFSVRSEGGSATSFSLVIMPTD